jgi:hypothetical protein
VISRYRELVDRRGPAGRHFLFEMTKSDGSGYVGYLVNRIPYNGDVVLDPNEMYGRVRDITGERGKKVGSYSVDWGLVDEVLGKKKDEGKVDLSAPKVVQPPEELKKTTQPDIPGVSWATGPKRKGMHWASVASTWTKGQVYCGEDGCYDVGLIMDLTRTNSVVSVKVSSLSVQLRNNAWGTDSSPLSPVQVMASPTFSDVNMKHMAKIRAADLSKPVAIRAKDGVLVDGNHRLARCVYEGREEILAVFVQEEQMAKAAV